jgi:hypothetical protein
MFGLPHGKGGFAGGDADGLGHEAPRLGNGVPHGRLDGRVIGKTQEVGGTIVGTGAFNRELC